MQDGPMRTLSDSFHGAWVLRWPFLLSHLVFSVLVYAILTPLLALGLRAALFFSGQPALSDFDIAAYLLSPVGFVCGLLVASLFLSAAVLDLAFMMAISQDVRQTGQRRFETSVLKILARLPKVIDFICRFLLRLLVIMAPFVVAVLLVAQQWLTEYDINYYLTEKPPEFYRVLVVGAILLAIMAIVLLRKLSDWAVALPLVLFDQSSPRESFARSYDQMQGQRVPFLLAVCGWALVSSVLIAMTLAAAHGIAGWMAGRIGADLGRLAIAFGGLLALWSVLNLLVTAVTSGALAQLIMYTAGWPGAAEEATPAHKPALRVALLGGLALGVVLAIGGGSDLLGHSAEDEIQVIAHRGAAGARPENTMASFALAIEDKADWIELDVQESADDEVIVMHDSDFMKIAGVDLKTWDATADGLADIDIGSWYEEDYSGERTPTLREVLELAKDSGTRVLIELKYYGHDRMLEQRVADVVEETGMQDQVRAMSLKYGAVQKMKALRPEWKVGLLATATVGNVTALEADFLAVNMAAASLRLTRAAHEAGKEIYVWTVNDPLGMSQMASLGVDGLITDEPALAREVLSQRAGLSSVERLVLGLGSQLGLKVSDKVYRDASP
ncbi:glycerophosphoryl diester phosphodiesterase [Aliiruegeria haliotis]|uniref:Glycerophosphoryl diester phosphodiesterase n=1 Tax=Aliiruegeria haliotis TaxID=1280846 RepID=A0A2T0RP49_9RHOB|nr:glycerophosphodiester phosphodiesterase family protein [Aliiruegeria haliotis]PRY22965.1 glycerophosphoryl diester phosphodiesterase [Aliiruegeria haliotis]